ncbi:MAG: hypothetical protein GX640_10905 [Fibrobacter sp.]|nr:hypothetical protein [Fibrobacter sp.]
MIGFDRPLRPSWIYKTLNIIRPGTLISEYYTPFEDITRELTGREGKRKVRTVLFRSFIYSVQRDTKMVENSPFIKWAQRFDLNTLIPIFFAKLLMDYDVLRFASSKIAAYADNSSLLNTNHFMNKVIQEYGDRDVVHRSLRSFFKTLEYFNLARKVTPTEIEISGRYSLNKEQAKMFLQLYSICYLKSKMVDLNHLESSIMMYFRELPVQSTAREFHGISWEYIREPSREILLMK